MTRGGVGPSRNFDPERNVELKAALKDGQISIDLEDLLKDESILAELAKSAVFDSHLITCISQVLVTGQVDWEDGNAPWWSIWTGKGNPFEAARQVVAGLADQVAQKLIDDLTDERNKLYTKSDELERQVRKLSTDNNQMARILFGDDAPRWEATQELFAELEVIVEGWAAIERGEVASRTLSAWEKQRLQMSRQLLKQAAGESWTEHAEPASAITIEQLKGEGDAGSAELLAALEALLSNPYLDLDDLAYTVREKEGKGWDGPAASAWAEAVIAAKAAVEKAKSESEVRSNGS